MRVLQRSAWPVWLVASAAGAAILTWHASTRMSLSAGEFATGYLLFGLMIFLSIYGLRKKLPAIPLGPVSVWLTLHLAAGVLAIIAFWLHVGTFLPTGWVGGGLAALFYLVSLSGILGYGMQLIVPARLVHAGPEIIYERIPSEVAAIRQRVEQLLLESAARTGSETLGRDYAQSLAWYFDKPRFFWMNVFGGRRAEHWSQRHLQTLRRYINEDEREDLARLAALIAEKRSIDRQYAMQSLLKRWPLVHVPLTGALITLACWHFVLVRVFAR
jgi:hypothetical protein